MGEMKKDRQRNLNPHAEARLAMALWSHEYAHEQRGGSMDFWDGLGASRQALCVRLVDGILEAQATNGRAPSPPVVDTHGTGV